MSDRDDHSIWLTPAGIDHWLCIVGTNSFGASAFSDECPQNSGSLDLKSARQGVDQLRNLAKSITVEEMVESTVIPWN
jgi:hypothetical protein